MNRMLKLCLGVFLALGALERAEAAAMTFSGTNGNLAASARFEVTAAGHLLVTLTNTSTADVLVPSDVLTGVFFTLAGDPTLTRVSATLASGSTVLFPPAGVTGDDVSGEWAYKDGLAGAPGGADEGISSSGLSEDDNDMFGPKDRFSNVNLQGPASPDGLQYGITSAGDNSSTGNTPVTGENALIKNSVVFKLAGINPNFDPSASGAITRVSFQYGTSLSQPNLTGNPGGPPGGVPEPHVLLLFGAGLLGLISRRRRD